MADVDALYDKVERLGHFAPSVDARTAYRGSTFGDFFEAMSNSTDKPVLLTEYGVDAYHDVCGSNSADPCYNTDGDSSGSHEDQQAQAAFALNLTREIPTSTPPPRTVARARRAAPPGARRSADSSCHGSTSTGRAQSRRPNAFQPTTRQSSALPRAPEKAHVTCGNWNASVHDLCGYQLDAAPDHYVNEEWFGITAPTMRAYSGSSPSQTNADGTRGSSLNSLRPRQIFWEMRQLWAGRASITRCLSPLRLVQGVSRRRLRGHGRPAPATERSRRSGRGRCATDWRECGPGGA